MSEDFYPFVDSGDPAPDNEHLTGIAEEPLEQRAELGDAGRSAHSTTETDRRGNSVQGSTSVTYATRISVYDDMLSTPRVIVVEQADIRTYLEDVTNTVHRTMKEQGGHLSLMVIRELVENFIHAQFSEPVISILDNGDTIRFADQGPGINDKERAFEFGVTSADRAKKRYIRGTGAGLPMVQQYIEAAGGAISVEDNLGAGTVVTVSVNPERVEEIKHAVSRGAAVRGGHPRERDRQPESMPANPVNTTLNVSGMPQPTPWHAVGVDERTAGFPANTPQNMGLAGGHVEQAQGQVTAPAGQMSPYYPESHPWVAPGGYPPYGNPYTVNSGAQYGAPYGYPYGAPYGTPYGNQYGRQAPMGQGQFVNPDASPIQVQTPQPGTFPTPYPQGSAIDGNAQDTLSHTPNITERGRLAIGFILENEKGGPTDLTRAFGYSDATWSRELDLLAGIGLIHKRGQKYTLTEMGRLWSSR